ncbi:isoprenylcysteine carboxylmethyltransferase family protein [Fibrobacter sp. UWEL]|uniref:methyltransferase family protein n=1 Tax=Fibrobacter sp. UWEL TaxID=1896209 RepID=UPI0009113870|nr:isoprenylcysteine carboxylmethyltransferase family protein [Fibrobacter sp. UWEL]SHL09920.1 Protein-S-isoprenylcysteine O-methyltransferase Ste14 [Fibrobacter sp. UWEL]
MNKLYTYRGWILGALAILMLLLPGVPMSRGWLYCLPMLALGLLIFAAIRVQARRVIGEHTRGFTHDADRLVTEGIYSRIRHPLYLSNWGIGMMLIVLHLGKSWWAILFIVVLYYFEKLLSKMEDRYLEKRFGDEWRQWAAVTPAFSGSGKRKKKAATLPPEKICGEPVAPLPPESAGARPPRSFWAAARADISTWFWLAFAITLIILRKTVLDFNILELLGC